MNGVVKSRGGGSRERESERDGEREVLQTVTGWWEGNLLVFSHQLGRGGDINRIGGREGSFRSWQGDETEECAYKGERLANRDKGVWGGGSGSQKEVHRERQRSPRRQRLLPTAISII